MKKIPTVILALAVGIALELLLLGAGGFDLRIGGDGPASMLLFITHMPAGFLCAVLPVTWQTDFAVAAANALLFSLVAFIVIKVKRTKWTD